ncbi:uncharacterized protein [Dendrobates tinctorius]|uniref:uncharacterized protein n=1 Tax=Dendrobates tinctorius TaxID=92724 RepID=UPI003CC9C1B7
MIFMQDNAPLQHKSLYCLAASKGLIDERIMVPSSLDLNPIENLWTLLKREFKVKGFGIEIHVNANHRGFGLSSTFTLFYIAINMRFSLQERSILQPAREKHPTACKREASYSLQERSILQPAREKHPTACKREASYSLQEKSILQPAREKHPTACKREASYSLQEKSILQPAREKHPTACKRKAFYSLQEKHGFFMSSGEEFTPGPGELTQAESVTSSSISAEEQQEQSVQVQAGRRRAPQRDEEFALDNEALISLVQE